jgi:hypothetical protein
MAVSKLNPTSAVGVNYSGGVEADRPAAPTVGSTYYNTTVESLQIWDGTSWNTISAIDETPVWTTAAGNIVDVVETGSFTATVVATDPEGGVISYSSTTLPAWASINSSTGVISGTAPSATSDTTYSFSIIASDVNLNKTSRTFNILVRDAFLVDSLVIVSGGGGGGHYGPSDNTVGCGGGGAGGVKTFTNAGFIPGTTYTVTVGAGAARRTGSSSVAGLPGNASSVSTFTTVGGGAGGGNGIAAGNGGSGGGGARGAAGGLGTSGEGNDGNPSGSDYQAAGSGGGGKAAAGTVSTANARPGNGGNGVTVEGSWIAGGGGGGGTTNNADTGYGTGGANGGGRGSNNYAAPVDGTANTGGGGGGNAAGGAGTNSSAGGSGFVLLKYADSKPALTATTGSPTVTSSGGFRYYYFTGSGSFTA